MRNIKNNTFQRLAIVWSLLLYVLLASNSLFADETTITDRMHHLRAAGPREWNSFPEKAESAKLELKFTSQPHDNPATLRLRQQDVKQQWQVSLNDKILGKLPTDENDMVLYFEIPAGTIVQGENRLVVEQRGTRVDDVRVGEIRIDDRARTDVLSEGTVDVSVLDEETANLTPCRITVINSAGALQSVGAESNEELAVRPGTIYTASGKARFGLPAGDYTIYVGRGFEYSLYKTSVSVKTGQESSVKAHVHREVPTDGYVACDTHVHTLTHSGHGDSTVQERMISIAGEGIELPIATDHNVHIDHNAFAKAMNVRQYFTPVIGNEVTTRTGHFNIFPVVAGSPVPDHKSDDWKVTLDNIFATPGTKVAILNHARDVHGGTRPFGTELFNDVVGENLEGWHMGFNAMEVINSGATQTDPLLLLRDWMALLNRGRRITPVGSSDSHDVARHFVGQGRTYIRCDDREPDNIDVDQAVFNFLQGRVMVSYGLLANMKVNQRYGSGELAKVVGDEVTVELRVLGPKWTKVDKVELYANGQWLREKRIGDAFSDRHGPGVLWEASWKIPRPKHDVHLVAIATGPGIDHLAWRTAKPYQPVTPDPTTSVLGCSGAVWIDADGDGRATSARDYATNLVAETNGDLAKLVSSLFAYDEAVAAQAAHLLERSGTSPLSDELARALKQAAPATKTGFDNYTAAWRENQIARVQP